MAAEKIPERYLILVDPEKNNNKFYKMIDAGNGEWIAQYGRVGNGRAQQRKYSNRVYNTKLQEKLAKGYKDVSDLHAISTAPQQEISFTDITDEKVSEFINRLMAFAKHTIKSNYTVNANDVTQKMVDEARGLIQNLRNIANNNMSETTVVRAFNDVLKELMHVIPRRIAGQGAEGVKRMMAACKADCVAIILREEDLLDIMEGQVKIQERKLEYVGSSQTLLEAMGIQMYTATDSQVEEVKRHLSPSLRSQLKAVYRVINMKTQERFDAYLKENANSNGAPKVKMLWHGSRNENWVSILQKGLLLKPDAVITGKMFGNGIYFAPSARKSWGYTSAGKWTGDHSDTAIMSLYATAYGVPHEVYSHDSRWKGYNFDRLQSDYPNCSCVHAKAEKGMLLDDEIIFYREDQMTISYICEFDV